MEDFDDIGGWTLGAYATRARLNEAAIRAGEIALAVVELVLGAVVWFLAVVLPHVRALAVWVADAGASADAVLDADAHPREAAGPRDDGGGEDSGPPTVIEGEVVFVRFGGEPK